MSFPIASNHLGDYRILVCRSNQRPISDLYAFDLRQPIPPVPIPLLPGDLEPPLELQPLLQRVYAKGRYHLAIDYTQPIQPKLNDDDQAWVSALLSNAIED